MDLSLYFGFVVASFIMLMIPGPNLAVIVANSLKHGFKYGLVTVAGTASAMVIQLTLVTIGLATLLENIGNALTYLKWAGVVYLLYIGYKTWTAKTADLSAVKAARPNMRRIFARGFVVSISNPKTLVFFGAFFPQFISADSNVTAQLAILSITFFIIITIGDSLWALAANFAKTLLRGSEKMVNRISGGFLMLGGGLLAIIKEK